MICLCMNVFTLLGMWYKMSHGKRCLKQAEPEDMGTEQVFPFMFTSR